MSIAIPVWPTSCLVLHLACGQRRLHNSGTRPCCCTIISPTPIWFVTDRASRSHLLVGKNSPTISSTRVASHPTYLLNVAVDPSIVFSAIITNLSITIIIIISSIRLLTLPGLLFASHRIASLSILYYFAIQSNPIATPKQAFAHALSITHFFPCMAQSP